MSRHAVLSAGSAAWRSLPCPRSELRLDLTLGCGQSFRWRETSEGHWTGVLGGQVWTLTQTDDRLWYHTYSMQPAAGDGRKKPKRAAVVKQEEPGEGQVSEVVTPVQDRKDQEALRDYFQLDVPLGQLYREWGNKDKHFRHTALTFPGSDVESTLRELGFGYRARFVQQSAKHILDTGGPDWLESLRDVPYLEAQSALRTLPGVGLKVADCVCLMSLDKPGAVPIDTHVWQIARRDYLPDLGSGHRSLTDRVYRDIGDFFRQLWGPYAGWAHSVLFCADLKKFQRLKPEEQLKAEEESTREAEEEARGKGAELGEGGGEIAVKRKRERT
ncbi:N-glycosylase/DNA lyase isoform X2 [Lepisosteus oculatus]|uniref:N-glycosylase/DNA lyase isoform X2 n=1 Tax=Lepisosteus oculatus TaxID=7918 RepID=UPI003719AF05